MSLPDFVTPTPTKALTIDVRSRRSERCVGVLALLGVVVAVALLPLPLGSSIALLVIACAVVVSGFRSQGWLGGPARLTTVRWLSDGQWVLASAARKNIPATLSDDSRAGSYWLWLRWHTDEGIRSMLLLKGDVLLADLRRLNVRLRLEAGGRRQTRSGWVGA